MAISRRAFLRGFSAAAGIAALPGCDLLGQLDPTDGEGIGIIAPARNTDQPDPDSTPTAEPDTWHMGAPMPTPRARVAGAAVHGRIYVMGGWLPDGASVDNEAYDPSTDRWQTAAPLPEPLSHAAAVGADGAIYLRTAWSGWTRRGYALPRLGVGAGVFVRAVAPLAMYERDRHGSRGTGRVYQAFTDRHLPRRKCNANGMKKGASADEGRKGWAMRRSS